MHLERPGKVPGSKGGGDVAHVVSNRGDPRRIRSTGCVEDDAPSIPKVLKDVGRRILIDAHDHLTACLHGREGSVGLARARVPPAPARGECEHKGSRETPHGTGPAFRRENELPASRIPRLGTKSTWIGNPSTRSYSATTSANQSSWFAWWMELNTCSTVWK